jgi:hypothetical protein
MQENLSNKNTPLPKPNNRQNAENKGEIHTKDSKYLMYVSCEVLSCYYYTIVVRSAGNQFYA